MKHIVIKLSFFLYKNLKRKYFLRNIIKKLIGKRTIEVFFNDFKLHARLTSAIEAKVIFDEYDEMIILNLVKKYASKGYDFIDVGANIGLHSLTASSANKSIEIFSFEPEPNNYLSFIKNIGLNEFNNIRPFCIGLGNTNTTISLNINEGWNKGKHSIKVNFNDLQSKINIPVTQLDNFCENINGNHLIIKIDVEGYEKEVLEGAKKVLNKTENIILIIELLEEINGANICQEIIAFLIKNNFNMLFKIDSNNELLEVVKYEGSSDYIFIKGKDANENLFNKLNEKRR
jgi:FkbM family methyltransferase